MAEPFFTYRANGSMNRTETRLPLYDQVCITCSKATTRAYSTSFSLSIRTLAASIRNDIYAVYGFVRLADEIVDSFHDHDREVLLSRLRQDTFNALDEQISANPILHAFQKTYHRYGLERLHVEQFLQSMEWDLKRTKYDRDGFDTYIVGSAEVVGLMCLKVFVRGDETEYEKLKPPAIRLGAAFQKVNFLRDLREDYRELGRSYFPDLDMANFNDDMKRQIEKEIDEDFTAARVGIRQLPRDARFGVFLAYTYYRRLLLRIWKLSSREVMEARVSVPMPEKIFLMASAYARHRLNID